LLEQAPQPSTKPRNSKAPTQDYIHVTIRTTIPAAQKHAAVVTLRSMIEQIKLEEGCLGCRLYQDLQNTDALMLEAAWSEEILLQRYLASDQFHTVLLVIEMAVEPPEIRFATVAHVSGLETIEKARMHSGRYLPVE
jgi:quinol monooxygenase YgiN